MQAQVGGRYGYSFLTLPASARVAALGGFLPQNTKADPSALLYNPAGQSTKGTAGLSYNPFGGRFRYTSGGTMLDLGEGTAGVGIQFIDYGTIDGYTPGAVSTGTYSANTYAVSFNYSKSLGPFRYGANFKVAGSSLESYSSFGLGVDLGLNYKHPTQDFSAGIALQNFGRTLKTFESTAQRNWPTTITAGVSYKFEHMPVRFYGTAQQLQQWDIVYLDPTYSVTIDASGVEKPEEKPWSEKLFRHATLGAELLLGKSIVVRGGYNHLYRKEMRIENAASGGVGYSVGTGLTFGMFVLDYTHMFVSNAGGANYIHLTYTFGKLQESAPQ